MVVAHVAQPFQLVDRSHSVIHNQATDVVEHEVHVGGQLVRVRRQVIAVFVVQWVFFRDVGDQPDIQRAVIGQVQVRFDLLLDLIAVLLVSFFTVFWIAPRLGFDLAVLPEWAAPAPAAP